MKIAGVSTVTVDAGDRDWIFVRVETDEDGLYGWGEASLSWHTGGVCGTVEDPTRPGIGLDLVDEVVRARPAKSPPPHLVYASDGALADW